MKKSGHALPRERPASTLQVAQFQSRLLQGLSFSASSEKTWKSQIAGFLTDAAVVMDAYFICAFFPNEDEKFELVFFWHGAPPPETRASAEILVREKLALDPGFRTLSGITSVHMESAATAGLPESAPQGFELQARIFSLHTLKERVMAGVGLSAHSKRPHDEALAIDSLLTAVGNIIGAVRSLSAYTREVERFATRDPLTNLYNQISFWDLLEYETSRSTRQKYRFSLLVIDIDNFKAINDAYGHEIGDAFLRDFSLLLKRAVRSGDIAARYAGDQFTAILPVCDESQATFVARRIIESLREYSFPLANGGEVKGTVSVGVAVFPDHARESRDLYLLADNMLTQAKSFGKDRLSLPSEQDNIEVLKSMGEKSILILEALSQHRIVPYFQPIMNIQDGKTEAYEVLTRIVTGDRVIAASEFIETAEGMGAIGKIDYQLFEQALAKVRECGYAGNMFINLSPKALVLNEFMPTIRKLLRDYGLDPAKLIFEITERNTVKNLSLFDKFINELKHEGFRFAIDDFGSGYSSFQYIKTFSIDFLKVDGEFVRNMVGVNGMIEKRIITSIAALATNLGIKTIAEYVESKEILDEVGAAGINYAQGYYIQKPSPDLL